MKSFLVCLCLIAAVFATLAPCYAQPANGVIANERIVRLPQDGDKWFVSVVGDPQDARYNEIVSWFDSGSLLALKNSVHFNAIDSNSAIFADRYADMTPELPMIRVQNAKGVIYSQVCGNSIPMSAQSLNAQIAQDVAARTAPRTSRRGCVASGYPRAGALARASPAAPKTPPPVCRGRKGRWR